MANVIGSWFLPDNSLGGARQRSARLVVHPGMTRDACAAHGLSWRGAFASVKAAMFGLLSGGGVVA
jgi:hypothetical protein